MKFPRVRFTLLRLMAAVGVMAVVFGFWLRREHFLERARRYAEASSIPISDPPEAGTDAFQEWERGQERQRKRVEHFDQLRLKYERAARYPWLPISPDPPEPEMDGGVAPDRLKEGQISDPRRHPIMGRLGPLLAFVLSAIGASEPSQEIAQPPSRPQFVQAMAKIKEGMTAPQIRELLGRPDDIRTGREDRRGFGTSGTRSVWCYGTSGHLTFPTLGRVYINEGDRAQYFWGREGAPPDPSMLPEQELRSLLRIIDTAPSYNSGSLDRIDREIYDPLKLIRVVNALQPLGKEKALAAISEYLRVCSRYDDEGYEGLFLILRVLFEVPADPGYMPRMMVGTPWPDEPSDRRLIPRFPIWLQEDIPILMVGGYGLHGEAEPVEGHVEYFRRHGRIRAKPLVPTNRPIEVPEKLMRSGRWIFSKGLASGEPNSGKSMLMTQILKVLRPVYRTNIRFNRFENREGTEVDETWKHIAREMTRLEIRWDSSKNTYTFKDGTWLGD